MLIGGILLGLLLGLLAGGRLRNLAEIRLRWTGLLVAAVVLRFATEWALGAGIDIVEMFRLPLLTAAFVVLLAALWINRSYPGLSLAFLGVLTNTLVIVANNGFMPIWQPALVAAGLTEADVDRAFHTVVNAAAPDFLGRLLILGDVIPVPVAVIRNVYSLGDVFLTLGWRSSCLPVSCASPLPPRSRRTRSSGGDWRVSEASQACRPVSSDPRRSIDRPSSAPDGNDWPRREPRPSVAVDRAPAARPRYPRRRPYRSRASPRRWSRGSDGTPMSASR